MFATAGGVHGQVPKRAHPRGGAGVSTTAPPAGGQGGSLASTRLGAHRFDGGSGPNALRYGRTRNTQEGVGDSPNGPWNLLRAVPISTIDFQPEAFPLITELAARQGITVYDASYVFLARSLTAPFVTADERLAATCSDLPYVWRLDAV